MYSGVYKHEYDVFRYSDLGGMILSLFLFWGQAFVIS